MTIDREFLQKLRDRYAARETEADFDALSAEADAFLKDRVDDRFVETLTVMILEHRDSDYCETWGIVDEVFDMIGAERIPSPWD